MPEIRKFAAAYFALQGIAILAWWILLWSVPVSRSYFKMGESESVLLSFWLADLLFLAFGSLIVSWLCLSDNKLLQPALWMLVGAIGYATLYCLAFALMTDTGWLGVVFMFPAMIWSGNFAIGISPAIVNLMFRRSKKARTSWILIKTLIQIIIVWSLILIVFPSLIIQVENKIGINQITFPLQQTISITLFILLSSVGVSGAIMMAKIGGGTPLPMDSANNLVVSGIYKFVRNPMAISGIGQGICVALFLGSPLVFAYALMGGLIWQFIYRKLEEDELVEKFGTDYEDYRDKIRCWIPRFGVYKNESKKEIFGR